MKIAITNAYTWYNKGDAAILLATIETLKKVYHNPEFYILSFNPDEDAKRYCKDTSIKMVRSNILNPHPYKHTKIGKIIAILKLVLKMIFIQMGIAICFPLMKTKNKTMALLNDADLIVVCGGGFLGGKKIDSLMHVFQIYIDTLFEKHVYMIGASIEPMNNRILQKLTENALKRVDYVFAREEITNNYLSTFIQSDKHSMIPDMAFMLGETEKEFDFINQIKSENKMLIGITVRNWNFPNSNNPNKSRNDYLVAIRKMMEYYIDKYNACFIFIPQVIVDTGNDILTAKKIKGMLDEKHAGLFIVKEDDWSPYEIKAVIGQMDFFIGTRMHSNIFATSMRIPTVAIAYEKKTNGIMNTIGLDDYVVEIDNITAEEIIEKTECMIKRRDMIKKILTEKINMIRNNINKELLSHLVKE